eukprot:3293718-Rhodomonas_salina.1
MCAFVLDFAALRPVVPGPEAVFLRHFQQPGTKRQCRCTESGFLILSSGTRYQYRRRVAGTDDQYQTWPG